MKLGHNYRQQLSMIFVILTLIAWQRARETGQPAKIGAIMIGLFGAGITVSHYATTFVFMGLSTVTLAVTFTFIIGNRNLQWFSNTPRKLPLFAVGAFIVFGMTWYMYVGSGILFGRLARTGGSILVEVIGFQTSTSASASGSGARWITRDLYSISYYVFRWLNYLSVVFITLGFISHLIGDLRRKTLERLEYIVFSGFVGVLLVTIVAFPSANPMDLARVYPIALFWIAPLVIVGLLRSNRFIINKMRFLREWEFSKTLPYAVVSLFLVVFLLFSAGFVPAVTGEFQYNEALVIEQELEDPTAIADSKNGLLAAGDVAGARFLAEHREITYPVQTDYSGIFLWSYGKVPRYDHLPPVESGIRQGFHHPDAMTDDSYVFFRQVNVEEGILIVDLNAAKYSGEKNYADSWPYIRGADTRKHLIYSSGARIYV